MSAYRDIFVVVVLAGCASSPNEEAPPSDLEAEYRAVLAIPDYLEVPAIPAFNPPTPEKIALGRKLFYDTRLSGNQTTSCGTCHLQQLAFADGKARPTGSSVASRSPTRRSRTSSPSSSR